MKKLFYTLVLCVLTCQVSIAGTDAVRFRDAIFPEVKRDSVVYSTENGKQLLMDVYQPVGDTARLRPLVIIAHGGSFLNGDRQSERMLIIGHELAIRGYVVASIDYRLANLFKMASKRGAYKAIIKAAADGRNSVRWFINDAAKGNTYRIDRSRIFFGGNSAGGILAEQLGYIDSAGECSSALCKVVSKYLPDSGALTPHAIRGILSLAGAVLDTNLIGTGAPDLLHIQGDGDRIVPYGYGRPVNGIAPFKLAGLGASRPRYVSQRLHYTEYVFKGGGHTPWDEDEKVLKVMLVQLIDFLYQEVK